MNSLCNIQGKKFKFNKFKFLELFNNKEGFIEGNANQNDETMQELESRFNAKLNTYGVIYDEYIKEKLVSDIDISTLLGKTATWEKEHYYISRKGVMRKLSSGAQNHVCLAPSKNITDTQKLKLKVGMPLQTTVVGGQTFYEKCGDEHIQTTGKVIQAATIGDTAWLDDLGKKYKFKQGDARHDSCPNGISQTISDIQFNMIKTGADLGPRNECVRHTLTKEGELNKLNNELTQIAIEMKEIINSVKDNSNADDTKIAEQKKSLDEIIEDLTADREKIKNLKKELYSLDGNVRDNKYLVDASNMQYIGWGVSLITVLVLSLYTMKK